DREGLGLEGRFPGLEHHTAQDDRRPLRREQNRAAGGIHPGAGGRARAAVLRVVYAVPVRVLEALAPDVVHFRPGRGVGTLVQPVRAAVFVRVERATGLVDDRAGGRAGALVGAVGHAIAVGVRRTALGVAARAGRRAGALAGPAGQP